MADKKENSRADELFEILSEYSDEKPKEVKETLEGESHTEDINNVDEILEILSRGSSRIEPAFEEKEEVADTAEIPDAIFNHLSEESIPSQPQGASVINESPEFLSNHFSEDDGSIPLPPAEEEDDSADAQQKDRKGAFWVLGSIVRNIAIIPKAVVYITLILLVSAYLSYYIITIGNDIFSLVTETKEVSITIEDGATHESVGALLEENGVITYGWVYEIYMEYRSDGDSSTEYIPGDYTLNTNYNYSQIITALTAKTVKREIVRVTIPEGFTVDQIIDLLVKNGVGQRDDYIEAINNYPYKWEFVQRLKELGYSTDRKYRLEGYLYPDTYEFYTTESEVYVINKMLNAFNDKFWKDFTRENSKGESYEDMMLEKYNMTFDDLIVLASLTQSEGGKVDDFYPISYVFHNRLSHPSTFPKLESDATIQYVLPERISDSEELDPNYESPYNTYLHDGLPPGAISNPGLDALYAAMFPTAPLSSNDKEIDAYFFVSNDAGKTYFASSKSSHEKNVAQAKADNIAIENGTYDG
ncbi:MAG: endolytic transglycosylase MltG [Clostridia bacterium]|nr:endolytic transglycosylase MltG [Clostridia bacterium]